MPSAWQINEQLPAAQAAISLRQLLADQWLLPSRFIHFLRIKHHVLLNGEYHPMNTVLQAGDQLQLIFTGEEFRTATSNYIPTVSPRLHVLFENRDLLVVHKPAGQKTHPNQPGETGTMMNDVQGYLAGQKGTAAYMVHRIDQATSGAVIVAKNPVVVPILDRQISRGAIHRSYVAVIKGSLSQQAGELAWPIGHDPHDRRKRMVGGINPQTALTHYQTVQQCRGYSLLKLSLATGRTHQIRVHLAYTGHPIVGDPLYNDDDQPHMLLHGFRQRLVLPFSNQLLTIEDPLPPYFHFNLLK